MEVQRGTRTRFIQEATTFLSLLATVPVLFSVMLSTESEGI